MIPAAPILRSIFWPVCCPGSPSAKLRDARRSCCWSTENFIKKLVFPVETLPVNVVAAGLVTEVFGVLLFTLALLLIKGSVAATVLFLPLLLIPQILFTTGSPGSSPRWLSLCAISARSSDICLPS